MAFSVLETITFHLAVAQTSDRRAQAGLRGGAPSVDQPRGRPKPSDVFSGQPAGSSRRRAKKRKRSRNRRSRDREVIFPVADAPPSPPPTLHRSITIRSNMAELAHRFVARLGPRTTSRLPPRSTFELTCDSEPEDSRPQPQDGSPRRTTTLRTNKEDLANEFVARPGPSRRLRRPPGRTFEFASDSEPEDPRPQPDDEAAAHCDRDNTIAILDVTEPVADDPGADGTNQAAGTPEWGRSVNPHHYPPANTVPVYVTGPPHPLGPGTSIISTSLRDEAASKAQVARRAERHVQFCVAPSIAGPTTHEGPRGRSKSSEPELEAKAVAPTTQPTSPLAINPQEREPPKPANPNPFWPFTPLPTHKIDRASLMGVPNFFDRKVRFPDDFKHISYNIQAQVAGRLRPYGGAWGPVVRESGEMIGYIDQLWDGRAPLPPVLLRRLREHEDIAQSLGGSRSMALTIQPPTLQDRKPDTIAQSLDRSRSMAPYFQPSTPQEREPQANAQSLGGSGAMALAFQPSTLHNTDVSVPVDAAALPAAAQESVARSILVSSSAGRRTRNGVNIRRPSVHFADVDDCFPPPAENASQNDRAIEDEEEEELELMLMLPESGDDEAEYAEEETDEEPEEDDAELAPEVPVAGSMAVPASRFRPRPGSDGGENAPMLIESSILPSLADVASTIHPSFRNNSTALEMAQARLTQAGNGTYSSTFRDPNVPRFLRTVQSGGQVIHNASYFNRRTRLNMTIRGQAPKPIAATATIAAQARNIASVAEPLSRAKREHMSTPGQDSVVPQDHKSIAAAPGASSDDDGDDSDDEENVGDNEDVYIANNVNDDVSAGSEKEQKDALEDGDVAKYPDAWASSSEEEDDAIVRRNMMQQMKRRSTSLAQRPIMDSRLEAELYPLDVRDQGVPSTTGAARQPPPAGSSEVQSVESDVDVVARDLRDRRLARLAAVENAGNHGEGGSDVQVDQDLPSRSDVYECPSATVQSSESEFVDPVIEDATGDVPAISQAVSNAGTESEVRPLAVRSQNLPSTAAAVKYATASTSSLQNPPVDLGASRVDSKVGPNAVPDVRLVRQSESAESQQFSEAGPSTPVRGGVVGVQAGTADGRHPRECRCVLGLDGSHDDHNLCSSRCYECTNIHSSGKKRELQWLDDELRSLNESSHRQATPQKSGVTARGGRLTATLLTPFEGRPAAVLHGVSSDPFTSSSPSTLRRMKYQDEEGLNEDEEFTISPRSRQLLRQGPAKPCENTCTPAAEELASQSAPAPAPVPVQASVPAPQAQETIVQRGFLLSAPASMLNLAEHKEGARHRSWPPPANADYDAHDSLEVMAGPRNSPSRSRNKSFTNLSLNANREC